MQKNQPNPLKKLNGKEVATLSAEQFAAFEEAVRQNKATRLYDGANGFMGKAKVKVYG